MPPNSLMFALLGLNETQSYGFVNGFVYATSYSIAASYVVNTITVHRGKHYVHDFHRILQQAGSIWQRQLCRAGVRF